MKKLYPFNEGGYYLTLSFQLWNWCRLWVNILGYRHAFIFGEYNGN